MKNFNCIKLILSSDHSIPMDAVHREIEFIRRVVSKPEPLLIKDNLTINEVAASEQKYITPAHLSEEAKLLYHTIKSFSLDSIESFDRQTSLSELPFKHKYPKFNLSDAINESIKDKINGFCYHTLKRKASHNGSLAEGEYDFGASYLRITMGEPSGESPGSPFVLEIWPLGHYSPVHNHANCHAIIRVLHGSINTLLYPYLSLNSTITKYPFAQARVYKNDVTYLYPGMNQIHKLTNDIVNDISEIDSEHSMKDVNDTCITIQCYKYDRGDSSMQEVFDYVGYKDHSKSSKFNKKEICHFIPNSDCDFQTFYTRMQMEWQQRRSSGFTPMGPIMGPSTTGTGTRTVTYSSGVELQHSASKHKHEHKDKHKHKHKDKHKKNKEFSNYKRPEYVNAKVSKQRNTVIVHASEDINIKTLEIKEEEEEEGDDYDHDGRYVSRYSSIPPHAVMSTQVSLIANAATGDIDDSRTRESSSSSVGSSVKVLFKDLTEQAAADAGD